MGFRRTTNNRMELMGVIAGLEALSEPCEVLVITDSEYVVRAIENDRAIQWRSRGWKTADRKPAKNVDLWQRLLTLCDVHKVRFEWVRGHSGHAENERCDSLANSAALHEATNIDEGFEAASRAE